MNATLSRRSFLHATALASGGLLLSFGWQAPGLAQPAASASLRPNGYVRLDPNGTDHHLVQESRHGPGREDGVRDDPGRGDGR